MTTSGYHDEIVAWKGARPFCGLAVAYGLSRGDERLSKVGRILIAKVNSGSDHAPTLRGSVCLLGFWASGDGVCMHMRYVYPGTGVGNFPLTLSGPAIIEKLGELEKSRLSRETGMMNGVILFRGTHSLRNADNDKTAFGYGGKTYDHSSLTRIVPGHVQFFRT